MTERSADPARIAAAEWLMRQRDAAFDDWEHFTEWLERDPAHAAAYADVSLLDADLGDALQAAPPALPVPEQARVLPRRRWLAAGLLVGAVGLGVFAFERVEHHGAATHYAVAGEGGDRMVPLPGGDRLVLRDGARVTLDRDRPRYAYLERGTALFDIDHDAERPFRVGFAAGEVVDLGTRFVVTRAAARTEVAVAEGEVEYRGATTMPLAAGRRIVVAGDRVTVGSVSPDAVAPWASVRLVYQDAPLSRVAGDLTRALGVPVRVAPDAAGVRVEATVRVPLGSPASIDRIGRLLGVTVRRERGGYVLHAA